LFFMLYIVAQSVSAQFSKGDMLIAIEGNYYKNTDNSNTEGLDLKTVEKYRNLSISFESFISNRLSIGAGLDNNWEDMTIKTSQLDGNTYTLDAFTAKSSYWMPKAFCKYYFPIANRLYVVPQLTVSYGKAEINFSEFYATATMLPDNEIHEGTGTTQNSSSAIFNVNLFGAGLIPEIMCPVTKKWGISFYPGGLSYEKISGDTNHSEWTFSFKRRYWQFGINYRL